MTGASGNPPRGTSPVDPSPTGLWSGERHLRVALAAVFYFGAVGTVAELFLLAHFDEPVQYAPFAALGLAATTLAWALARPGRSALRATRGSMATLALVGAVGVVLHYRSNAELELEMEPALAGPALAWLALRGATPALAPGQLAQLGLIGFLFTLGHPALRREIHTGDASHEPD